ncbi:MAG: hypothetical protein FDZ70_07285 [Actinobacteria bacterium]|nr:MAG: hypothetical protein FDZ70_07285 [Actinomycetota bacterium]
MTIDDTIREVLEPLVGKPVTEICIHSVAIKLSKKSEALTVADLPEVAATMRESLGAFATQSLIDGAVAEIARRSAA